MSLPDGVDPSRTAFFLDFDGTLCEIVDRPDDVELRPETREALRALVEASDGALAIISGRGLADLDRHLAPFKPAAAGSHGAEVRMTPGGEVESAVDRTPLEEAEGPIAEFAERENLLLERKAGALTLHYRSRPDLEEKAKAVVAGQAEGREELRVVEGNMVVELTICGIDKGEAVEHFLASMPFKGRTPLAAGDDTTDEDAFAVVQSRGGLAIRVGSGKSIARYRAADTAGFLDWLDRVAAGTKTEPVR